MVRSLFNDEAVKLGTSTTKEPKAVFPALSVASQDTLVLPIGKTDPEARLHFGAINPSTLSYAPTMKPTSAPDVEVALVTVTDGNMTCGGMASCFRSLPSVCLLNRINES